MTSKPYIFLCSALSKFITVMGLHLVEMSFWVTCEEKKLSTFLCKKLGALGVGFSACVGGYVCVILTKCSRTAELVKVSFICFQYHFRKES